MGGSRVPEALPGKNIATDHSTNTNSIMEHHTGNATYNKHMDLCHTYDTTTRNREQIRAGAMGLNALHEHSARISHTLSHNTVQPEIQRNNANMHRILALHKCILRSTGRAVEEGGPVPGAAGTGIRRTGCSRPATHRPALT